MPTRLLRAAMLIPYGEEAERWISACAALAEVNHWRVASLVREWEDLATMVCERLIDVGIVGQRDHLPPDRIPRLEIVEDHRPPPPIPGQRRPKWH